MLDRKVALQLSPEEIKNYGGPIFYVSHHAVTKPDSESTPNRIVFNSSAKFGKHVLNDYWGKGPDIMNNPLGIMLRFREEEVAIVGDLKKMYHSVFMSEIDQHVHRFLWRDLETYREPSTYIMTSVSFGDRPAGNIATVALRKTAEIKKEVYPDAANVILKNSYVDDLIDSFSSDEKAQRIVNEISEIVEFGRFKIKNWIISSNAENHVRQFSKEEKVLGIMWNVNKDVLSFNIRLNFSVKVRKVHSKPDLNLQEIPANIPLILTRRMLLSQINSIYDPIRCFITIHSTGKSVNERIMGN